jgi:hypothetical protein
LQAVCKGGASIQNYIAAFSDKLQPHLGGSVKAADTFAAIYANNMQQVQVRAALKLIHQPTTRRLLPPPALSSVHLSSHTLENDVLSVIHLFIL